MAKANSGEWIFFAKPAKILLLWQNGVTEKLKLPMRNEFAMLNQDRKKQQKKGVTQKLKLHHQFTTLNQDSIIHISNFRL